MARTSSLLASVPDGYGIVFNRLIILALSTATLAVYAATYSIYNARVASTGGLAPSHNSPLTANGLSLVPSAISIVWSITHLSLLARRLVRSHRRNSSPSEGTDSRAVVHPIWPLLADCTCFVLFVVAAVLTGVKVTKWRNGKVEYGSEGTRQVDLHACPTFDPATGKLDYWCGQAWNQVVNLTNSGTSIMGTLAGIHLVRLLYACYDLYLLQRHHCTGGTHAKHCGDDKTTDCHSHQAEEVKLEEVKVERH